MGPSSITKLLPIVSACWGILLLLLATTSAVAAKGPAMRIGVAQALPFHDLRVMAEWADYLERKLDRPVFIVNRRTHTEIVDLLMRDQLDIAWVCPDHYRRHRERVTLIAGPVFQGRQKFQLLVVAPSYGLPELQGLLDLRGKVIAFAEPDSNLGSALVKRALGALGADPEHFFRRTIYTGDHERVIRAVAGGVAHAGAVMDQAWEVVQATDPALAAGLRVIMPKCRSTWLIRPTNWPRSSTTCWTRESHTCPRRRKVRALRRALHFACRFRVRRAPSARSMSSNPVRGGSLPSTIARC